MFHSDQCLYWQIEGLTSVFTGHTKKVISNQCILNDYVIRAPAMTGVMAAIGATPRVVVEENRPPSPPK